MDVWWIPQTMRPNPKINEKRLRQHSVRVTSGFFPHFHFLVFFRCPPQHPSAAFINTAGSAETGCQKLFVFRRRDFTQQLLGPTTHYLVPFVTKARRATFTAVPLISDSTCVSFFSPFFCVVLFFLPTGQSCKEGEGKFTSHLCKQDRVIISCTGWRRRTARVWRSSKLPVYWRIASSAAHKKHTLAEPNGCSLQNNSAG